MKAWKKMQDNVIIQMGVINPNRQEHAIKARGNYPGLTQNKYAWYIPEYMTACSSSYVHKYYFTGVGTLPSFAGGNRQNRVLTPIGTTNMGMSMRRVLPRLGIIPSDNPCASYAIRVYSSIRIFAQSEIVLLSFRHTPTFGKGGGRCISFSMCLSAHCYRIKGKTGRTEIRAAMGSRAAMESPHVSSIA